MREENPNLIYNKRKRHYSSFRGETSLAPPNLVNRDFKAEKPNKLWLVDVTEMKLSNFKSILSPIIDYYDGKVISYEVSSNSQ